MMNNVPAGEASGGELERVANHAPGLPALHEGAAAVASSGEGVAADVAAPPTKEEMLAFLDVEDVAKNPRWAVKVYEDGSRYEGELSFWSSKAPLHPNSRR